MCRVLWIWYAEGAHAPLEWSRGEYYTFWKEKCWSLEMGRTGKAAAEAAGGKTRVEFQADGPSKELVGAGTGLGV